MNVSHNELDAISADPVKAREMICRLADERDAARRQRDVLNAACDRAIGFVTCASSSEDWCGCDDCRKEFAELKAAIKSAIDKAKGKPQ